MPFKDRVQQLKAMLKINQRARQRSKVERLGNALNEQMIKFARKYPKFRRKYSIRFPEIEDNGVTVRVLFSKDFTIHTLRNTVIADTIIAEYENLKVATDAVCKAEMDLVTIWKINPLIIAEDFQLAIQMLGEDSASRYVQYLVRVYESVLIPCSIAEQIASELETKAK
jgi:hypothetical protein